MTTDTKIEQAFDLAADQYASRGVDPHAAMEQCKTLPFGAVWDYYCHTAGAPVEAAWLAEVKQYETDVLSKRSK